MGTQERLGVNIHVDQLMDGIANNCAQLERLELRWDPENLRFSDKSQKAVDILRVKCLKLKALGLRWVCVKATCQTLVYIYYFFYAVMAGTTKS